MSTHGPQAEVRKKVSVRCGVEMAFRVWTEQIDTWWPKTHSRSGDPGTTVVMESGVGGRIYERTQAGEEHEWGEVIAWEAPRYFTYNWYLGSGAERPTRVDVSFFEQEDGSTRVEVTHRGPELIGDLWSRNVSRYDAAWEDILPQFAATVGPYEDK